MNRVSTAWTLCWHLKVHIFKKNMNFKGHERDSRYPILTGYKVISIWCHESRSWVHMSILCSFIAFLLMVWTSYQHDGIADYEAIFLLRKKSTDWTVSFSALGESCHIWVKYELILMNFGAKNINLWMVCYCNFHCKLQSVGTSYKKAMNKLFCSTCMFHRETAKKCGRGWKCMHAVKWYTLL